MPSQEIKFHHPITLIQVYKNVNIYGKDKKSVADRRDALEWKVMQSKTGHVLDGLLYLPEQILENPKLHNCDIITIEDNNKADFTLRINNCFHFGSANDLEIFRIQKQEEIELYLQYSYFSVGIPKRNNFKLCELVPGQAVEIKINGKTESSLTSRRERTYMEQAYIFEHLGTFDKCVLLKEPYEAIDKQVPKDRKVVDMIKPLW